METAIREDDLWFVQVLERMGTPSPKNFSWFVGSKLAGMGCPRNRAQLAYLAQNGIKTVVNLTEMNHYSEEATSLGIAVHQIPIPDYCSPSLVQIQQFMSLLDSTKEAVGVHCGGGYGRTGTMLACYLVAKEGYSADEAIKETRRRRRGSIETQSQEQIVKAFEESLKKPAHSDIGSA